MSRSRPAVAVLYNAPVLPADDPLYQSEADVVAVAKVVVGALVRGGFEAWEQPAAPPLAEFVAELEGTSPDVIFNLIEGFNGESGGEAAVTGLLTMLRLPYTGCPPLAQSLCHQKGRTKALLRGYGLPTAPFVVVCDDERFELPFAGPYFVKPNAEDASLGIDQSSVVSHLGEVVARVDSLRKRFGPEVMIESYLPGAEFNVGVLALPEPEALPVAEVVYSVRSDEWPILTYAAKWEVGSVADLSSPARCPARIAPELAGRLQELAVKAFRATGCRDYARVDFRLDAVGEPMILEVNPNPDLGPTAGWARALGVSGRDYEATLVAFTRQALVRGTRDV
jgi:D-alanine-D-alanine ligase